MTLGTPQPNHAVPGRPAALLMTLLLSCTGQPSGSVEPGPTGIPSAPSPAAPAVVLPVLSGGDDSLGFLEGMRLAAGEVGIELDVSGHSADLPDAIGEAVSAQPAAVLVVGPAAAIVEARPDIEAARVPVVLLGGDLYSDQALFRYAFQTSVPLRWQARVIAHYLAADRGDQRVAVSMSDRMAGDVFSAALAEEGLALTPPADAEALILPPGAASRTGTSVQLAVSADGLRSTGRPLPPGTVACSPYTWAGWADMLPRVHRFRERLGQTFGHAPTGLEQEGYEAVRALADALDRTGGVGGDELVGALESFREETYSAIPIRLGPDDHVLAEQSQLGLFAVASPDEVPASGEVLGAIPWRPIMRTFTTDGQKVNLLDRDKRVFFPGWGHRKPSPRYWKSGFGIVTRPDEDQLH